MGSADDRTFKVNFSAEGVAKLSEIVRDKLKEFMGDYTDDTLVEYVIVLLRNGRDKQAARDELNVFLEEDSDSFVSWLWDHLASNLDLYVCCQESCTVEVSKTRFPVVGQLGENEPDQRNSQFDSVNSDNLSRSRHKREWKGRDANKPPPPQSSAVGNISSEEKGHRRATCARSPSPQPPKHRKRIRHDEQLQRKRDTASLPTLNAPRRLLQFAVRDAVGTPRQSVMVKESPSTKRLCSIVSTPTDSPLVGRPRRIQSIARVPNAMAAVARAVQEAAEDVRKVRSAVSVFDRLGCDTDASELREQVKEFRDADVEDEDYIEFNQIQEQTHLRTSYLHAGDYVQGTVNARMLDSGARFTSVSTSDDGYDDFNGIGHGVLGVSQTGPRAGNGVKNTLISQHSAAMNVDEVMPIARNKEQDIPASAPHSAYMVANSSVNANTWKPPNYQESGHVGDVVKQKSVSEIEPEVKYGGQMMTRNNSPVVAQNQSVKPPTEMQKESQKTVLSAPGLYTAGRPLDDADSRTIFVSNVHFAATKDSLSRHFNKFGDVLKVIIVTDPATGQPKGSAYVEFMQKEAADKALSLDGTSFMSRILKVVKRSSAHHDATTSIMTWPLTARGSPYATSRFPRAPFPRGISGGYRSRFPVKPGVRSMQWKRGDAKATQMESGASQSGQGLISQRARSLTYVRMESKPDGNSGTA